MTQKQIDLAKASGSAAGIPLPMNDIPSIHISEFDEISNTK